jgi:hypothetical protein
MRGALIFPRDAIRLNGLAARFPSTLARFGFIGLPWQGENK